MNTKKFKIFAALLGLILAFAACQPDEFSLGKMLSKEDLSYSITQNPDDPNMIYLESLTPGVTPMWVTPMGRSIQIKDTLRIPFAGDYEFTYGVQSEGGFVQDDVFNLSITTTNLSYVDDPLWTNLTGGPGNSKTWRLDYGNYGLNVGPLTYCEPLTTWTEWQNGTAAIGWAPSWKDNTWIIEEADTASRMTFSLIGGAKITTHKVTEGVDESGTFFLDVDNHTLSTTDATILRSNSFIANATNWNNNLVVLSLTENQLMVGVRRTNDEGDYLYVWNFVSEEYAASYVPADQPDPEPELPDGWQDDISQTVSTTIIWKLSESNPIDWANLDGSMMNGWQTPEDYPDWLGTPDPSAYGSFSMTMNSADQSVVFVTPDGTTTEGTFSFDEKGIYSFDVDVPSFSVISWASFAADANNQLRILQIEKDASGAVTGMWLGARSSEKDEYMAYHLVPQAGGGGGNSELQGTEIAFDNSKLAIGDLEDKGNLRLELYNEYGSTKADPGINISELVFSNRIDVTFTISGVSLNEGAVGSYETSMYYADADWDPNGNGDAITVNGDGTYTVSYTPESDVEGAAVFVIDLVGMGADITDLTAVTATIDKVVTY